MMTDVTQIRANIRKAKQKARAKQEPEPSVIEAITDNSRGLHISWVIGDDDYDYNERTGKITRLSRSSDDWRRRGNDEIKFLFQAKSADQKREEERSQEGAKTNGVEVIVTQRNHMYVSVFYIHQRGSIIEQDHERREVRYDREDYYSIPFYVDFFCTQSKPADLIETRIKAFQVQPIQRVDLGFKMKGFLSDRVRNRFYERSSVVEAVLHPEFSVQVDTERMLEKFNLGPKHGVRYIRQGKNTRQTYRTPNAIAAYYGVTLDDVTTAIADASLSPDPTVNSFSVHRRLAGLNGQAQYFHTEQVIAQLEHMGLVDPR